MQGKNTFEDMSICELFSCLFSVGAGVILAFVVFVGSLRGNLPEPNLLIWSAELVLMIVLAINFIITGDIIKKRFMGVA